MLFSWAHEDRRDRDLQVINQCHNVLEVTGVRELATAEFDHLRVGALAGEAIFVEPCLGGDSPYAAPVTIES